MSRISLWVESWLEFEFTTSSLSLALHQNYGCEANLASLRPGLQLDTHALSTPSDKMIWPSVFILVHSQRTNPPSSALHQIAIADRKYKQAFGVLSGSGRARILFASEGVGEEYGEPRRSV